MEFKYNICICFSGFFSTFNIPCPFNTSFNGTHLRYSSASPSAPITLKEKLQHHLLSYINNKC